MGRTADAPLRSVGLPSTGQSRTERRSDMPRYVVERAFPEGLAIPGADGAQLCLAVVDRNAHEGVTWLKSYISEDKHKSFCVYDAPTPEAIRKAASANEIPVDRITQVRVLDPYRYV
jgi:hypothetical protein